MSVGALVSKATFEELVNHWLLVLKFRIFRKKILVEIRWFQLNFAIWFWIYVRDLNLSWEPLTVSIFELLRSSKAFELTFNHYCNLCVESLCFFHWMCRHYQSRGFCFMFYSLPKLSSCEWINTCRWFIKKDNLWFFKHGKGCN